VGADHARALDVTIALGMVASFIAIAPFAGQGTFIDVGLLGPATKSGRAASLRAEHERVYSWR
jgi:hypothetical protein